jgi:hypothetical protein
MCSGIGNQQYEALGRFVYEGRVINGFAFSIIPDIVLVISSLELKVTAETVEKP